MGASFNYRFSRSGAVLAGLLLVGHAAVAQPVGPPSERVAAMGLSVDALFDQGFVPLPAGPNAFLVHDFDGPGPRGAEWVWQRVMPGGPVNWASQLQATGVYAFDGSSARLVFANSALFATMASLDTDNDAATPNDLVLIGGVVGPTNSLGAGRIVGGAFEPFAQAFAAGLVGFGSNLRLVMHDVDGPLGPGGPVITSFSDLGSRWWDGAAWQAIPRIDPLIEARFDAWFDPGDGLGVVHLQSGPVGSTTTVGIVQKRGAGGAVTRVDTLPSGPRSVLQVYDPDGPGPIGQRVLTRDASQRLLAWDGTGAVLLSPPVTGSRIVVLPAELPTRPLAVIVNGVESVLQNGTWQSIVNVWGGGYINQMRVLGAIDVDGAGPRGVEMVVAAKAAMPPFRSAVGVAPSGEDMVLIAFDGMNWRPATERLIGAVNFASRLDPDDAGPEPARPVVAGELLGFGGELVTRNEVGRRIAMWNGTRWTTLPALPGQVLGLSSPGPVEGPARPLVVWASLSGSGGPWGLWRFDVPTWSWVRIAASTDLDAPTFTNLWGRPEVLGWFSEPGQPDRLGFDRFRQRPQGGWDQSGEGQLPLGSFTPGAAEGQSSTRQILQVGRTRSFVSWDGTTTTPLWERVSTFAQGQRPDLTAFDRVLDGPFGARTEPVFASLLGTGQADTLVFSDLRLHRLGAGGVLEQFGIVWPPTVLNVGEASIGPLDIRPVWTAGELSGPGLQVILAEYLGAVHPWRSRVRVLSPAPSSVAGAISFIKTNDTLGSGRTHIHGFMPFDPDGAGPEPARYLVFGPFSGANVPVRDGGVTPSVLQYIPPTLTASTAQWVANGFRVDEFDEGGAVVTGSVPPGYAVRWWLTGATPAVGGTARRLLVDGDVINRGTVSGAGTPTLRLAGLERGTSVRVQPELIGLSGEVMLEGATVARGTTGPLTYGLGQNYTLRARFCSQSDVAGPGQAVGPDGDLTADDAIVFLNWLFAGDARADVAGPGPDNGGDGAFTADDLIVFLNRFFAGCQ